MNELNWGDYGSIFFAFMGMLYFASRIGEWLTAWLFNRGWCRIRFTMFKDKKSQAIDQLLWAFNLSKKTIGKQHIMRLTHGYTLIIISDEEAKRIWAEDDAKKAEEEPPCGTSSTTAP